MKILLYKNTIYKILYFLKETLKFNFKSLKSFSYENCRHIRL